MFWDVHDWLFRSSLAGHGLFIFKPVVGLDGESLEMSGQGEAKPCEAAAIVKDNLEYSVRLLQSAFFT